MTGPRRFEGKVAVVTGAARGIGRAIVGRLAHEGASIVVQDLLEDEAQRVAGALVGEGGQAIACGGDAGDPAVSDRFVELAIERFGRLDFLVNNAASAIRRPLLELSLDDAEATMRATFWSVFHATQRAGRHMVSQGEGAIVMVGSLGATAPVPYGGLYSAAKAGVHHLMRSFAMELAQHGIRVNAVAPGYIDTPGERALTGQHMRHMATRINLGRVGTPDDVAGAVAFLLSDDAAYVVGEVLTVDGALSLPLARRLPTARDTP